MNPGIDTKFVEEHYQRMSDEDLIRIATQEAYGLTPEAFEIMKSEIKKRGLNENLLESVKAQNKTYSPEEIEVYCNLVRELSCPVCGNSEHLLNATITGEVVSYIFFTSSKKQIKVGCPDCLDKLNDKALTKTALLGWWGIPWGIIKTIQYIVINIDNKRLNHSDEHNESLRSFALDCIGELEMYKDDKEKLQQIVRMQNMYTP